jgi:carbamoyl-phosphate synthase large subunit
MAIGRSFEEAIQKGIRMVGQGMHGFVGNREEITIEAVEEELENPTDRRIFAIAEAFYKGYSVEDIYQRTKIDRWFLQKLQNIFQLRNELWNYSKLETLPLELLKMTKKAGFSDFQIARLVLKLPINRMEEGVSK